MEKINNKEARTFITKKNESRLTNAQRDKHDSVAEKGIGRLLEGMEDDLERAPGYDDDWTYEDEIDTEDENIISLLDKNTVIELIYE